MNLASNQALFQKRDKNHKLKTKRQCARLTQVEVAKRAGITTRAYQRYEAGTRVPAATTAIRIAKAVNGTVEELWSE